MYFSPTRTNHTDHSELKLELNGTTIKRVNQTKFLGVIIDDKLSWVPHINTLAMKLKSCIGALSRIKEAVPVHLHKNLYHTLFESHLSYGISVLGRVSANKLSTLFTIQKTCIRILVGDKEAFLDKFKTCVRNRPLYSQHLGSEFYTKEHTKPLFNHHDIFTVHNLYNYHCSIELFKILKTRTPISLFSKFTLSSRKDTLLIISYVMTHTNQSHYNMYIT